MKPFLAEGIILHSFNYRDYDKILSIFTKDEGVVKAVKNGANRPKNRGGNETSALTQAEFLLVRGKQELMKCREISVTHRHYACRQSIETLNSSCELLQLIRRTQLPGKAAPALYTLLSSYLKKIPEAPVPELLCISFQLKLLRHEGRFPEQLHCSRCEEPLDTFSFSGDEYFCKRHAPYGHIAFSPQESLQVKTLAFSKSFPEILSVPLSPDLTEKANALSRALTDFH